MHNHLCEYAQILLSKRFDSGLNLPDFNLNKKNIFFMHILQAAFIRLTPCSARFGDFNLEKK